MMKADLIFWRKMLDAHLKSAAPLDAVKAICINPVADPADMTREAADREVSIELLDRDSALVRLLRPAIARIQDGSYGICLECEEEIAPRRLKAIPWAELCIRCQERAENVAAPRQPVSAYQRIRQAA